MAGPSPTHRHPRVTFHPLIDEPGGSGPTGRRWYKRADGVGVGLIRVGAEDAYTTEGHRHAVNDWTVKLMSLNGVELDRREHLANADRREAILEMVYARRRG